MKKPAKAKKSAVSKLKGPALAAFEEFEARLKGAPNPLQSAGQLRLLEVGIGELAAQIPDAVLELLDAAAPISVAEATARAGAAGKSWQDVKATLELQVKLIRARARFEKGDTEGAGRELVQIGASPSSRRAELIIGAASRDAADWSPTFSLALLRAAAGSVANSLPAAFALIDALTGSGEKAAATLLLEQIAGAPGVDAAAVAERTARLS